MDSQRRKYNMPENHPQFKFMPQSDITAYELAWIMKLLLKSVDGAKVLEDMPESCHRHLASNKITNKLESKTA